MAVIIMCFMAFYCASYIHSRKQSKNISLQNCYQQLDKTHKGSKCHTYWSYCKAPEDKNQAK